jgi:demethylmenaquinone methyltransferase/2-methoxy-6-polyprenyl-1,4-benzoquinol methylase
VGDKDGILHAAPLLASQRTYYDERAADYGNALRPDRKTPGLIDPVLCRELIDEFNATGAVLELACGTGIFTAELVRHADSVTAVDSSPRMLALNEERVGSQKVTYVEADIFAWEPDRTYDSVFFGAWLSHVPPSEFARFWALVAACLRPNGRVAFVDEDDRAAGHDELHSIGGTTAARRMLSDGRQFEIVKVFWSADDLERELRSLGWDIHVRRAGETFLYGCGRLAASV